MNTTPLQHAIIISSIIGSIMSHYDPALAADRKNPINEIRRRIKKYMFTRSRSNKKEFLEAVKYSDIVWRTSVNHFAKHNIKIDAVSTVIRLYDLYAHPLSRYANINEKQMEAYAYKSMLDDNDIEQSSYEVSDFILDQLATYTGIKRKKLNLLQRVKNESKVA